MSECVHQLLLDVLIVVLDCLDFSLNLLQMRCNLVQLVDSNDGGRVLVDEKFGAEGVVYARVDGSLIRLQTSLGRTDGLDLATKSSQKDEFGLGDVFIRPVERARITERALELCQRFVACALIFGREIGC